MKRLYALFPACALFAAAANAADVDSFLITKGQEYRQTNAHSPILLTNESPFRFFSAVTPSEPNSVASASLRLPSGLVRALTNSDGEFTFEQDFRSKALLDAAFGIGSYRFVIATLNDGVRTQALTLPADAYPPVPRIANWNDTQDVESSRSFTLYWNPFTNGTINDFILLDVEDSNGQPLFSSPGFLDHNALNGTNIFVTLPENTFATSQSYNARLLFVKRTGLSTTTYPGATGISGFNRQTMFAIDTLPAPPPAGRIEFSMRNFSASEASAFAAITVTRSGTQGPVSVHLATEYGSAIPNEDYTPFSTTLAFADGMDSINIPIALIDDFRLEGHESVNLALSSPTAGAILGNRSNAVLTILDNERAGAGMLQFSPVRVVVTEQTPTVKVTITRVGGTVGTVSASFHTTGGSALSDVDFISTNGTVVFPPGIASRTIPIRILNDSINETNETFSILLDSAAGGAALGSNTLATVVISDNDLAGSVAFSAATFSTNEFGPFALITVLRTGGGASGVGVEYSTQDGSAVSGEDYLGTNGTVTFGSNEMRRTFAVPLLNDFDVENNESLTLRLTNPSGGARLGAISNATLTILNDESTLSFTNAHYSISELGPVLKVNVIRTGARISPVSVNFTTGGGDAASPSDYRGTNGILNFPPNIAFRTLSIPIINDTLDENDENFVISLFNPQGGALLGNISNATVLIRDNDQGGVIRFAASNYNVLESAANASITLTRSGGIASGVSVEFYTTGINASAGEDYADTMKVVNFGANEISKTVLIPIVNDCDDEPAEGVLLSLANATGGATIGTLSEATLTIRDNDAGGTIGFSAKAYSVSEATTNGSVTVTISRSGLAPLACEVTVEFATQEGSADEYSDYEPHSESVIFAANETKKQINIKVFDDPDVEGNETVFMTLRDPSGGGLLAGITNATLTILDDEVNVEGIYKVTTGSISLTGCTDSPGGKISLAGEVELFNQVGNEFEGGGTLIATSSSGYGLLNLWNGVRNAKGELSGYFDVISEFDSYSGTFKGSLVGNNLQLSFTGDANGDTCHLTGTFSGARYVPATNGFAPARLENVSATANISSGSGVLASTGSFEIQLLEANAFVLNALSGNVADASGYYVYHKTGLNSGTLMLAADYYELNEQLILTFTSPPGGTYSATAIPGTIGRQAGTFTVP